MARFLVSPSKLQGEIIIPPSKSHTLRAILFGALANGKSVINNYLKSPDAFCMLEACRLLGAEVNLKDDSIEIKGLNGEVHQAEDVINAGNSGIVLRFISAIAGLGDHPIVLTGDHSIRHQRPIGPLLKGLEQLGVKAVSCRGDGFAPVIIQGPIQSGETLINGQDSQPVSALLIASIFAKGPIRLIVENPGEKPWIALTLKWLDYFNVSYENQDYQTYIIKGNEKIEGFDYHVPGDLSSCSFPIAAALVTGSELTLKNVDMNDSQGDKQLIHVFQQMGAPIDIDEKNKILHVGRCKGLKGIEVDINDFIDSILVLSVVACFAEGKTHITNAGVARQKECDRIKCITQELTKMGANIQELADGLIIQGGSELKGAHLYSHKDHRMAMSLAVAAMGSKGEAIIDSTECVSKTYPSFAEDFRRLGAQIEEQKE